MSEPLVCAILLTRDRPAMAARAVRAFREQTYQNKRLLVYDTGSEDTELPESILDLEGEGVLVLESNAINQHGDRKTIGYLRNRANAAVPEAYIFIHWDDDDVSHPNRITEQVAHLQASGADVVAYDELLFWRDKWETVHIPDPRTPFFDRPSKRDVSEAWLYRNRLATAGSSFCYWRKTWERKPFPDVAVNEDSLWARGLEVARCSSFNSVLDHSAPCSIALHQPRLICSIHGGNTLDYDIEGMIARGAERNWIRSPQWDAFARERMAL